MPDDYKPSTYILGKDTPTRRNTPRKRTGLFIDMDQPTTSKASIIHTSSGCKNWQEFFELAYECRGVIVAAIRRVKEDKK